VVIADARTGEILAKDIGGATQPAGDPRGGDSPVKPFYNPGFFAGWSGGRLYVYDFSPNVTRTNKYIGTNGGTWSGRIVEIEISNPSAAGMTRNRVFGVNDDIL
jgi:hypothetical protein